MAIRYALLRPLGMPYNRRMDANKLIDDLGGTNEVARLCDVKPPSVSEWRRNGIPKPWLKYFKAIRPDLFERDPAATKKERRTGEEPGHLIPKKRCTDQARKKAVPKSQIRSG